MKDYFATNHFKKAAEDCILYGNVVLKKIKRKWYNPFRYLMCEETTKRIKPEKFFTE